MTNVYKSKSSKLSVIPVDDKPSTDSIRKDASLADILHLDGFKHFDHQKKTQSASYKIAHVRNKVCETPSRATDDVYIITNIS
jgi:hypothetical protein